MTVEGQFDGIFDDSTTVAGRKRRGSVGQLHAGESLQKEREREKTCWRHTSDEL